MELWIRSQDKEKLVLAKGFETQHTNYDGGCQIFAVWENNYQMVGKYKTKKRALEVLNQIQRLLEPMIVFTNVREQESIDILKCRYDAGSITTDGNGDVYFIGQSLLYEIPEE